MKNLIYTMLLILIVTSGVFAQWNEQQLAEIQAKHKSLLVHSSYSSLQNAKSQFRLNQQKLFSVLSTDEEASIYVGIKDRHYVLCARKEAHGHNLTVSFSLYMFFDDKSIQTRSVDATMKTNSHSFSLECQARPGFTTETFMPVALALITSINSEKQWWEGMLVYSPIVDITSEETGTRSEYYSTKALAVANVPTHVSPKGCFVWDDGVSPNIWRPIPGTGCAHWVAHQEGIYASPGCYDGLAIRVSQVTSGKTQRNISSASVGDVWTTSTGAHCGLVIQVISSSSIKVRHCSSGQGGVVESTFSSGYVYR